MTTEHKSCVWYDFLREKKIWPVLSFRFQNSKSYVMIGGKGFQRLLDVFQAGQREVQGLRAVQQLLARPAPKIVEFRDGNPQQFLSV